MQADLFDVRGKVALVTGASGGLGKRFAELLAGRGARVVLAARRQERLDDLVKSLRDCGHEVSAIVTDVLDDTSVVKAFEHATETFGCPQIIINNAGVSVPSRLSRSPVRTGITSSIPICGRHGSLRRLPRRIWWRIPWAVPSSTLSPLRALLGQWAMSCLTLCPRLVCRR